MILVDAMLGVGFSNCRDEWWHYSYGDAGYAVRMAQKECCYGLTHLAADQYLEQELLWIEAAKTRQSPFVSTSSEAYQSPSESVLDQVE